MDAIKKIDARENKMKEEIGKYAQGLRENIEKNNRKNKHLMSEKAKEIDKSLPIFSCKLDRWVLIHASCEN
jgi:septation ring formation regulator EzrA